VTGRWTFRTRSQRHLAVELFAIPAVIVLVALLLYELTNHKIHNPRPLGGTNVLVTARSDGGSEMSFAAASGGSLFGTTDSFRVWASTDGGRTWRRSGAPSVSCGFGWPRALAGPRGEEILGFLVERGCNRLTSALEVSTRSGANTRWSPAVQVARPTWKYGFDDAPSLAVDTRSGRIYAAWSRNLDSKHTTVVTSTSDDDGRTWSAPRTLSPLLSYPHWTQLAVAPDGTVYAAGIDVRYGLWVTRSTDGGHSFEPPHRAAPLLANPARWCGLTGFTPIPNEIRTCSGPDPTLLADGKRVLVVYDDAGANGTGDVFLAALDAQLHPLFRARVTPPDRGKSEQYTPTATVDPDTGTIWACWYDTTYDPNAHRAWFTCSASHTGRTWTPPERAAAQPSGTDDIGFYAFENGLYPSVVAAQGVAHPFWADSHVIANGVDAYTAALPELDAFALFGR